MKLASFDIFDTTLIRKCGEPDGVFEQLAKKLYPEDMSLLEAFLLWRRQVGAKSAGAQQGKEVSLKDMYDLLDTESFGTYNPEEMMAAEKAVEAENLMANPAVKNLIQEKRDAGYAIAFVSDMYLDSAFLKEVLMREGCAENGDSVYVSCEHGARKDRGQLYDIVRKELRPTLWEHFGDNRRSDVKMARKKSIKATHIDTTFNAAEKAMLEAGSIFRSGSGWRQLVALSRAARIHFGNTPYTALAADFVAPAYIPYVLFVLQDAQKRGIKRLYFLSRDSYILMKIAETLGEDFPEIELRYLFVSRKALLLPYLAGGSVDEYLAAADHHTIVRQGTVDQRLEQLGTNRKEMEESFQLTFPYHRVCNKKEEQDFLNKVFASDFTPILQQRAKEREETLLRYFDQEGVTDGTPSAMVDVGWLGTTRLMINSILRKQERPDSFFYYFGIRGDVLPPAAGKYLSFFRSNELSTEGTALIENYFSASPYPTTIGYKENNNNIRPIFPEGQNYTESPITQANIEVAEWISKEIKHLFYHKNNLMLKSWSRQSILLISETNTDINFTPMLSSSQFDKTAFVKRLTCKEAFCMTALGQHITAFDKASLRLFLPKTICRSAWRIHEITAKVRRKIYLKYLSGK